MKVMQPLLPVALRAGMKVEAKYQVPKGFNPALGYDVMEMAVARR